MSCLGLSLHALFVVLIRNLTLIVQIYNNITNASLTQGHSSVFNCIIYVLDCSGALGDHFWWDARPHLGIMPKGGVPEPK